MPVARTKQTVPRKEWKELKKQQQAGGKSFHTSAATFAALQPSCYADSGTGTLSPAVVAASVDGVAGVGIHSESPLSFGWATGEAAAAAAANVDGNSNDSSNRFAAASSTPTQSDSEAVDGGIAARLSQMSLLGGCDGGQQQARSTGAPGAPPLSAFPPLHAVLASHLALLGPAACSRIGLRIGAEGPRGTR